MGFPYFVELHGGLLTSESYNYYVEWDPTSRIHDPQFIGVCDNTPFRYYHHDPVVALTGVRVLVAKSHVGRADAPSLLNLNMSRSNMSRRLIELRSQAEALRLIIRLSAAHETLLEFKQKPSQRVVPKIFDVLR